MFRKYLFAKLVAYGYSNTCKFNHESQDFSLEFRESEYKLKIDKETGIFTTTTVPNVQTTQVTTTSSIDVTTKEYVPTIDYATSVITSDYATTEEYATTERYYATTEEYATTEKYDSYHGNEAVRAAIEEKIGAWSDRLKRPCKIFTEKVWRELNFKSFKWTVCPFGGVGKVTDRRFHDKHHVKANYIVFTAHNAHWKQDHRATYQMTVPDHDGCPTVKKLEINFVCKEGIRDAVKRVTREFNGLDCGHECCARYMEIATNAAC
jgi:hypothetical protein